MQVVFHNNTGVVFVSELPEKDISNVAVWCLGGIVQKAVVVCV